jgi:glycosyltransferase involved in cell wall biosynthesis
MAETPGVVFHDRVGQRELAEAYLAAKVWAYSTWFTETSCCHPDTKISVPGDHRGGPPTVRIADLVGKSGFPVYAFNEVENRFQLATCRRVWETKVADELVAIELDDGAVLRLTPEHKVLTFDGEWVPAGDLSVGDSLRALHYRYNVAIRDANGRWTNEHRLVGEWKEGRRLRLDEHVDHADPQRLDNRPEALAIMSAREHASKTHAGKKQSKKHEQRRMAGWREWANGPGKDELQKRLAKNGKKLWDTVNALDPVSRAAWLKARVAKKMATVAEARVGRNHRIVSIARITGCAVYDMEVEGLHNFVADGVVVHNCIGAMEAQAAGCVPVTTAEAALPETVKHGILIPPPDNDARYAEAFVANCVNLLQNESAHKELADQGRIHARTLGWDKVADAWERLFHSDLDLLQKPRPMRQYKAPLRVAVVLGKMGAAIHGQFDINEIFDTGFRTGTVLGFFGIAWGLAERGHTVDAFCDTKTHVPHSKWGGAHFYALDSATIDDTYDAYISVNEPDLLRPFPKTALRVCVQWLNDFSYCQPGWDAYIDQYVLPSKTLQTYLGPTVAGKSEVVPIGTNIEFFLPRVRRPGSIAYCSSPDRGLHHLLRIFPEIKKRVPEANLRIYYRFTAWYEQVVNLEGAYWAPMRERAEEIYAALEKLKDSGVTLVGPVPPKMMAAELAGTKVLAYPCDTVRFSEGYSVSILDACAAGCAPVISGVDALPEIYKDVAHIIDGTPNADNYGMWVDAIVKGLQDGTGSDQRARLHAEKHSRQAVAKQWEDFLYRNLKR